MTTTSLLEELEPLTHRDRMKRMVRLGTAWAAGDAHAEALLEALWASGTTYERTLALQAVYGSRGRVEGGRDVARVVDAVTSASRTLRFRAMRLVATACDDASVAEVLGKTASRSARARLLAMLQRRGRHSAVAAFLEAPGVLDEPRNVDLLPLATSELVAREIDRLRQHGSSVGWTRLAKHHAELAAAEVERAAAAKLDARSRSRVLPILALASKRAPGPMLAAVGRLVRAGESVATPVWNELAKRMPCETFDLLRERDERAAIQERAPGAFAGVRLGKVAHRLGAERLAHAVRRAYPMLPQGRRGRRWLLRLAPEDRRAAIDAWASAPNIGAWGAFLLRHMPDGETRRAAFERWVAAARDKDGIVSITALADLPHDLRHEEAERHLERVPVLAGRNDRLGWAQLLPFERARASLASFLGHPEGEIRALAASAVIRTLDGDRASVEPVLELVKSRRFEQDPVRLAMINALADQPWACFPPSSLPGVAEIVEGALAASDLSTTTTAHTERLVVRLFRVDPEWGAAWLAALVKVRGSITQLGLGDGLLPDDLVRFEPAFTKLVEQWATRERAASIAWLARSLGKRLALAPSLLTALERLARELPFVGVAAEALAMLRRATPERFGRLVPELLAEDASFVALPLVANHVSCMRQDLLPGVLERQVPMAGRFATGRSHWVLDFAAGTGTWTATCQRRWGAQLAGLVADPDRDVPTLRFAIDRLASLAFAEATPLLRFTSDVRQPVREIAIDAAARLDAGQGVETLLACLGDDRARWAIYALRSVFAEMPRHEVLAHLRVVPRDKVTVAKEVVRLLGELDGDEAFAEILAFDIPQTKRDVRIAMLRALWEHLHRPEAWAAFERAAADSDWVVASRIADVPMVRLTEDAETRLADLLARVLDRPEAELRLELLKRAGWLPLRDVTRKLFRAIVRRIRSEIPNEARAAVWAALCRVGDGEGDEPKLILDEVRGVLERRATAAAVLETLRPPAYGPPWRRKLARWVLGELAKDPRSTVLRIDFGGHFLDARELTKLFESTHADGLLHVDAIVAAFGSVDRCASPGVVEELLRNASGEAADLRRIALHALVAEARSRGWTRERRALLETYRRDGAMVVASAAAWIFPPVVKKKS